MSPLSSLPKYLQIGVALLGASAMIGCGAAGIFPDSTPLNLGSNQIPVSSISGSVYGGHAPLVGAHVYLVQPGTTGYGSLVTGLLSATSTSTYPSTANGSWTNSGYASDQFVPATDAAGKAFYGLTTDANGQFNITGDYTCTVGSPVMLIAYGGSASYVGQGTGSAPSSQTNTFPVSSVVVSNVSGQASSAGTATYTFNIGGSAPELFYPGEVVTFTGTSVTANSGADPTFFNNKTGTFIVSPTSLSTTGFQITFNGDYGGYPTASSPYFPAGTTTQSGATVTANPPYNPAVVNIAVLGLCPSTGNFSTGSSALKYVYMNEISTAAFAYAMNQYANWAVNDQSGNDEFHIGSPNTTQALQGIANAALNAGNLYDIQGGNQSTTFAGEGHIARSLTASGAGIVPQSTLDTVGNILAACVDSNNTYRLGNGTVSPQCNVLETYATDNGVYDSTVNITTGTYTHVSFNIAQAALNIAHYPQGAGTGTTSGTTQTVTAGSAASASAFTQALFTLPSGNVPFAPQLTSAPNDFAVGINWQTSPYAQSGTATGSTTNQATVGEVAIDSLGNAWIVANGSGSSSTNFNGVFKLAPTGYYTTYSGVLDTAVATNTNAGIAIDRSNNLFLSSTAGVQELQAAYSYAPNGGYPSNNIIGYINGNVYSQNITANAGQLAIDNAATPNIYVANLNQSNPPVSASFGDTTTKLIKEPAVVGNGAATFTVTANGGASTANTANACTSYMAYLTLDGSNNIWTSNSAYEFGGAGGGPDQICKFSNTGTLLYSYYASAQNGRMIAADATGNAFWPNYVANTLMRASSSATSTSGSNGTASTYTYAAGILTGPWAIAVDGANTLWVVNRYNSSSIVHVNDSGVLMSPTFYTGNTAAGGFNSVTGSGATTPSPSFAVIDQSGNLWTADAPHGEVLEWIGVAAPTVQPMAQQRYGTAQSNGHGIGQLP